MHNIFLIITNINEVIFRTHSVCVQMSAFSNINMFITFLVEMLNDNYFLNHLQGFKNLHFF